MTDAQLPSVKPLEWRCTTPWHGLKDLPKEIWILNGATLVNRAGTMALPFLVLYLTRTLAISPARAALALTTYGIAALVAMPFASRLSDRLGPLAIIETSLFSSGGLLLIYPLAHDFTTILLLTFLFGALNESVRPPSLSIISDRTTPAQRKPAFALNRLAINLGMSIGPAIGGVLALVSFRLLFLVDGTTSILAAAVLTLAPWPYISSESSRAPELAKASQFSDAEEFGRELEADSIEPLASRGPVASLRAFGNGRMLYFLAALIPVQIVFFQVTSTVPLFFVRYRRLPVSVYGLVFTVNTLIIVVLEVALNTAMARWQHRHTLALGAILYAVGFGSFAFVSHVPAIIACVVIWTFGEMIFMPGSAAYVSEIAPPDRLGEYMGLYTMSFSIAFSAGPWIGAQVLERWGPTVLWAAAFGSGCLSTLLLIRVPQLAQAREDSDLPD
jgi:MFS family permease